jgi:hypothetical protein
VFLGFFVGLALYAYIVMAAVQDKKPPIIGAFVATVLTIAAMLILLGLVYSSINQMRPSNVIRQIHDRVLLARARETRLLRRTRRRPCAGEADTAAVCRSNVTGYVTKIDLDMIAAALDAEGVVEVVLHITLGQHVSYGDDLASIRRASDQEQHRIAGALGAAVVISRQRNLEHDATAGIDDLVNIAWTSGSTSKQSPEVSRQALHALRDLGARWLKHDPADLEHDGEPDEVPLPIVYEDNDLDRIFDCLYSLLVVAQESHQHMEAARVLETYQKFIGLCTGDNRRRLERDLDALRPIIDKLPASRMVDTAVQALRRECSKTA